MATVFQKYKKSAATCESERTDAAPSEFNDADFSPAQPRGGAKASHDGSNEEKKPEAPKRLDLDPPPTTEDVNWDLINQQEEERRKMERAESSVSSANQSAPITFKEAFESIRANVQSWKKFVDKDLKRVSDFVETKGFWASMWSCLHADITEGSEEYSDRDFVLSLQFVTLNHEDAIHRRILITIFRKLMKTARGASDPGTRGGHWEKLGFQGGDPATDLRSTGILGLLQVLYLLDYYPTFCGLLFRTATNPIFEFPFILVCFNFSGVAMESLKERGLHDDIHAKKKKLAADAKKKSVGLSDASKPVAGADGKVTGGFISSDFEFRPPAVMYSVCEFYVGALFAFFLEWKKSSSRSVADFGPIKAKLRPYVREHVKETLKHCEVAADRKKVNDLDAKKADVNLTSGKSAKEDKEFMEF